MTPTPYFVAYYPRRRQWLIVDADGDHDPSEDGYDDYDTARGYADERNAAMGVE